MPEGQKSALRGVVGPQFTTALHGVLDLTHDSMGLANAGHLPLLLHHPTETVEIRTSPLSPELQASLDAPHESEAEPHHQAFHDPLSGLPNRALFGERMRQALARTGACPVIGMLLDLDNFKQQRHVRTPSR